MSYSSAGVSYDAIDPIKRVAQKKGEETAGNLHAFGLKEVSRSRGESAYIWEEKDSYRAFVIEGLGTKNLVADQMSKITGKNYYNAIAQDTVAAIVNDIITTGAMPQVINAYFGLGEDWFANNPSASDLIEGWASACNLAGAAWGGGETPLLKGIINPDTIDLVGSCVGIVKPKSRLTLGDKLQDGDAILLIESSGIHANGLSLGRSIAEKLPARYSTQLADGKTFGESLLIPTHIYVSLVRDLFDAGVDIHYMVNITGHGWRKLMRATVVFSYIINQIPPVPLIFDFVKKQSGNDDYAMYGIFNMGAGFAIYLPENQIEKAQAIADKHHLQSWHAGILKQGPLQVVIKPKNITFKAETLGIR